MAGKSNVPVLIKRKKVVAGDGHHGGAWKVAYADFVTAMMAFFMMLWLLNATTEKQRRGIADYFSPTIAVSRTSGGGESVLNGDTIFSEDTLIRSGISEARGMPTAQDRSAEGDAGQTRAESRRDRASSRSRNWRSGSRAPVAKA